MSELLVVGSSKYEVHSDERLLMRELEALGHRATWRCWDAWQPASADARHRGCIVRAVWDYFDDLPRFQRWLAAVEAVMPVVNPAPVIRANVDKTYLLGLGELGVPIVPTVFVADRDDLRGKVESFERWGWDLVVKPRYGTSGDGVARAHAEAELYEQGERHWPRGGCLVQPFLASIRTDGETSLIYLSGTFSHAVRKVAAAGGYRVNHNYGGKELPHEPTDPELELGRITMGAVDEPPAFARVDLMRLDSGDWVLSELELVEPILYLELFPDAGRRLADAVVSALGLDHG